MQTLHPRNNPHPARGRKLFIAQLQPLIVEETTHTPQGDGNSACCNRGDGAAETTHTPQGDGNPSSRYMCFSSSKQPTPRKGTETHQPYPTRCNRRNNPHPARGRKQGLAICKNCVIRNNPHPARGRKHRVRGLQARGFRNNPHPARGRKLCIECVAHAEQRRNNTHPARGRTPLRARGGGSALTETTHTPQGDGKPFVFTVQKLLEKPFTSLTGDY